jgi:hypothetical protein
MDDLTFLTQALKAHQAELHLNSGKLQIHLPATDSSPSKSLISSITQQIKANLAELHNLQVQHIVLYGMGHNRTILWKQAISLTESIPQDNKDSRDPYSFNNPIINCVALPAFLLLGSIANFTVKGLLLSWHLWTHEVGHAIVAWLAGHRATPLPFGWTNTGEDRSIIVYLCFLTLIGIFFWKGWQEKKRLLMGLAAGMAVLQFCMTWIMSQDAYDMWLSFGGIGGEFYLSTALLVCFYVPLPNRLRWDFWRYPLGFLAASTLLNIMGLWYGIRRGTQDIPWGSMWGGEGDAGGDMDRLANDHNWTDGQIIQTYSHLGNLCVGILIGVYVFILLRHSQQWQGKRRS